MTGIAQPNHGCFTRGLLVIVGPESAFRSESTVRPREQLGWQKKQPGLIYGLERTLYFDTRTHKQFGLVQATGRTPASSGRQKFARQDRH